MFSGDGEHAQFAWLQHPQWVRHRGTKCASVSCSLQLLSCRQVLRSYHTSTAVAQSASRRQRHPRTSCTAVRWRRGAELTNRQSAVYSVTNLVFIYCTSCMGPTLESRVSGPMGRHSVLVWAWLRPDSLCYCTSCITFHLSVHTLFQALDHCCTDTCRCTDGLQLRTVYGTVDVKNVIYHVVQLYDTQS